MGYFKIDSLSILVEYAAANNIISCEPAVAGGNIVFNVNPWYLENYVYNSEDFVTMLLDWNRFNMLADEFDEIETIYGHYEASVERPCVHFYEKYFTVQHRLPRLVTELVCQGCVHREHVRYGGVIGRLENEWRYTQFHQVFNNLDTLLEYMGQYGNYCGRCGGLLAMEFLCAESEYDTCGGCGVINSDSNNPISNAYERYFNNESGSLPLLQ